MAQFVHHVILGDSEPLEQEQYVTDTALCPYRTSSGGSRTEQSLDFLGTWIGSLGLDQQPSQTIYRLESSAFPVVAARTYS